MLGTVALAIFSVLLLRVTVIGVDAILDAADLDRPDGPCGSPSSWTARRSSSSAWCCGGRPSPDGLTDGNTPGV